MDPELADRPAARLPRLTRAEAHPVRPREPLRRQLGAATVTVRGWVELVVDTAAELPVGGESPVLLVGERELPDYETVAPRRYRFYAWDPVHLAPGAPLALAWPGRPETRVESELRYQPGAPRVG